MAFWNHTQVEELQNENQRLQEQVLKYHREMIRYKDSGNTEHSVENANLKIRCNLLQTEVDRLKQQLDQSVSRTEHEESIRASKEQILGLRKIIENLRNQPKPHNERGAGRKSRITPEHVVFVKKAKTEGKSLSEIARLLSDYSERPWSKSTIRYILIKY